MEERKLLDIVDVEDVLSDTINSEGDYRHALRLVRGLSHVQEQDIVKPYLEKFSTLVSEHNMNNLADDEMSNFERDILKLINNLLSESEDE